MVRLIKRAGAADRELLAGLVSTCRYCGCSTLPSPRTRARSTSSRRFGRAWGTPGFCRRTTSRFATLNISDYPYILALSLAELHRNSEVLPVLRELEHKLPGRLRDFAIVARTLLEGNAVESMAAVGRIVESDFRDPEGLFYLSRHLAHVSEVDRALELFERFVASGYFCFPTMARDPWLDSLRKKSAFIKLLRQTQALHDDARLEFERIGGPAVLGAGSTPA